MKFRGTPIHAGKRAGGKDLGDLRGLRRPPLHSFLRKIAAPPGPRVKGGTAAATTYILLAAFASSQLWQWALEYITHRLGPRHPYQSYGGTQSGIYPLQGEGDEVRIALAGDWGTGTDEAAMVGRQIAAFDAHYTIHLGDVYYVGDRAEIAENFLGEAIADSHFTPVGWPRGRHGSFSLLGNHEMYARGIAYFTHMLPWLGLTGEAAGQQASFFCLENAFWRVIGLDTGYNSVSWPFWEDIVPPDCALPPALMDWLERTVRPTADDGRGIILLSHHQYFSAFDICYPKAAAQLSQLFKRPVLWFWGHEHRLTIYDTFAMPGSLAAFGRCIGHGGMPVDLPPDKPAHPECPVLFVDRRVYENDEGLHIGMNGFARLTFRSERLHVDYVDLHGTAIYAEEWCATGGPLQRVDGGAV